MYANTGYEALYHYLGLSLQSAIRGAIISEVFFKGVILLIFGVLFLVTVIKFFSRYLPGTIVSRQTVPLSKFFWIVASLFLGLSLLRVSTSTIVKNYKNVSWEENPYVASRLSSDPSKFKVSLIFDIMSKTSHEVSTLASRIVDKLFAKNHSQLEAPDFFYKAIMFAGNATIDDPNLKKKIDFYTEECMDKVFHLLPLKVPQSKLIGVLYGDARHDLHDALDAVKLRDGSTCLDQKNQIAADFYTHVENKTGKLFNVHQTSAYPSGDLDWERTKHLYMSSALLNHYSDKTEAWGGISKGAQVPGTAARVFQYLRKIFSWDGVLSIFGRDDLHGASLAAKRSEEFNQLISRAPHVKGFIVLFLIAAFPLLIFPIVAGRPKWLIWWFLTYFSVLLWTPIWTLFYHIITNIAVASDALAQIGELDDGLSLYAAKTVTSRIYYLYSIYSWIQVLSGPFFTGLMLMGFRPLLRDTEEERAPSGVSEVKSVGGKAVKAAI